MKKGCTQIKRTDLFEKNIFPKSEAIDFLIVLEKIQSKLISISKLQDEVFRKKAVRTK